MDNRIILLAAILDRLSWLVWAQTKDAQHGRGKPESVLDAIIGVSGSGKCRAFESGAAFEKELKKLREEG